MANLPSTSLLAPNNHLWLVLEHTDCSESSLKDFVQLMEVTQEKVNSEILKGNHTWQPVCGKDDNKSVLGLRKEEQINLFALTSGLFGLGEKTEEAEQILQSKSHDEQEQPNSALNSIVYQVIATSASIFSQCQRLSFAGEEEIVEMEEADILAEHTHLCTICGKEFRRDGNLRIHMRSHGDQQYKSHRTLTSRRPKERRSYYSCPFQGCRHNRHHPSFKHLKSMVSLRNHYRRSHCAKMYACNNCGKEFSFVGDLKTHGNKCGHSTWHCSCTLTFSRRDKLLRHVALGRQGHKPVPPSPAIVAPNGENSGGNDKTLENSAQDLNNFAAQDSPFLTEGLHGYGNDQDVLLMGVGVNSIEESEYADERMQSEINFSSESYASLFWQHGDLLWL
ncbi:hypothetical protein SUGI_0195940 [Cryptomeria japonica]|uniref:zinc finger protein STAR3 n=1 Tax=Cryptomeria japonica TaxID=3369 RepID=UPI002408BFBE|nr:zinc finger protein STAR3 [Cryptomeria japonica]GLJ12689.1 hypothetical protein SUGI_0195940 [Cryptomeria japonica]